MTNYTKSTNFASKDSLPTGNALKIVKGTEIDTEFNNIVSAVATKADSTSPTFTGTPAAPTASTGTSTTQVATTAFVANAIAVEDAVVALKAPLASPTFTGTPAAPTASVNTSTTQVATTAFVLSQAAAATPLISGTAAVGTATKFAREDHVHPLSGVGVGQTWTDVKTTPGRVVGTTYTNSTGKPIQVNVYLSGPNNTYAVLTVSGVVVATVSNSTGNTLGGTLSAIVPNGATYIVTVVGMSLFEWAELR